MRASGVNAAIARYKEAGAEKKTKLRAIGITRIWVARIIRFYCNYTKTITIS